MARKVLLETAYTFTASTRTIVIPKNIPQERLVLITNVTTNQVIFNFSDPNLRATSYTAVTSAAGVETTTIVLNYNTGSMNNNDKLQITLDEYDEKFSPSETFMDPVGKMRVSTPQAMIDTDFEYSTQSTKWESVVLLNNRPSAFYDVTAPLPVSNITGTGTRVVTVATSTPPAVGSPVFIQDSTNPIANGWYLVESVSAGVSFTYTARANVTNGTMFDNSKTYVYSGSFYSGAGIPVSTGAGAAFTAAGTVVTATTTNCHGLSVGDGIYVIGTTASGTTAPNGSWVVRQVPTSNTVIFDVVNAPVGTITAASATGSLYQRSYGFAIHRPFDGGVSFSAGTPYHGNQFIRQSRRYFRYQSGKGIQFSTGTSLKPTFQVDSLTSAGTTVTVTTKFPHNLGTGAVIVVSGANEAAYNGTFTVTGVTDTTFTYTAGSTPSASPATGFPISVGPSTWFGSRNRVGMFDEQNGFFFEFDGQQLYAARRSSTDQLSGVAAVNAGSASITGTNTRFADQLVPGDYVVLRGMSYQVVSIPSQTQLIISPEYRGTSNISNAVITKTVTTRVPQSQWNIDRCDGTGPSRYNLDLTKMQMIYIDYSWYGAGAIRFGFKNQRGEVIYCHRIPNANLRSEAYMRSGNLPSRYECNTIAPFTNLTATLANAATSMSVADTSAFPNSGTVVVQAPGNTGAVIEYINYTGKTSNTLTGLTRAVTNLSGPGGLTSAGGTSTAGGGTFTVAAGSVIQVSLHAPQCASTLSHWGSSVMMDGRYDDDKQFVFTTGMTTTLTVASGATNALLSVRLAPSVDSGITGVLGIRDLINRMQLTPRSMGVLSTGQFLIRLVLNGRVSSGTFVNAGGSSLAQVCLHGANTTITGGETIFSFFTNNSGGTNATVTAADLTLIRDLGNSILGGGTNNNCPTVAAPANLYPDGPDIVTIVAVNIGLTAANANARFSWTEAQA